MLIEKITGHSWGTDIAERFAKPLGLEDTRDCLATPIIPRRARGYEASGNAWINTPYLAMSQPYAAGAMCSTIGDLTKWNRALNTGRVVSAASYALMTTPEGAAAASHYGFGMARDTIGGRPVITHGGGINGFATGNAWVPAAELSITVLANSGSAPSDDLVKQLARAALGVPLAQPPKFVPFTTADRARFPRYVGVYALALPSGPRDLTIADAGDHLTAQLAGQPAVPILYIDNDTFGVGFDPNLRFVFTMDGARATKVTLLQGGQRFDGPRK
jgi:CubicO group peptidase (beta-lactamase class C family)